MRTLNIDKQIDKHKCPASYWCVVATTGYSQQEREHECYLCWKSYCKENNITIIYD